MKALTALFLIALAAPTFAHNFNCSTSGASPGLQFGIQASQVAEQDREDRAEYGPQLSVSMVNAQIVLGSYRVPVGELTGDLPDYYREDFVDGRDFRNDNFTIVLTIPQNEFGSMANRRGFRGTVIIPAPYTDEDVERPFTCR